MVIEPHYMPVSAYLHCILKGKKIILDDISTFQKQSYRNRTYILGANGILKLIVPLKAGRNKLPFKDIKIDYSIAWQRNHWQSILSAYNNSPWFFFYYDNYERLLSQKYIFLIDLNISLTEQLLKDFQIPAEIRLLSEFDREIIADDLRDVIHPKKKEKSSHIFQEKEYIQVFHERFGFVRNLSSIDLLFNTGPLAFSYLI